MTIGGLAPGKRRGWLTAPGWSSWLPMRWRGSPAGRQGWLPSKPPSHASLKKAYKREPGYPWTCSDGPRQHGTGERDPQGRRVRGDRELPSDALDPRGTWRLPNCECLAGGDRRLVRAKESEYIWRCLTLAWCQSVEDLSLDRLLWRTPLSARFDPTLCWARDTSRSSEGLICCSGLGPCSRRNSGTHGWLRWSVTNKLIPVRPGWLGDMGRVTRKTPRKRGGVVECKSGLDGRQASVLTDAAVYSFWSGMQYAMPCLHFLLSCCSCLTHSCNIKRY